MSDGILVFAIESGSTSLLPTAYGLALDRIDMLPKGTCLSEEEVIPSEMCVDGAMAEEIRQLMIDIGVVAVC